MNAFPVWIRPQGTDGRVRVDSMTNATWLINRLSQSFVFKGSEAVNQDECSPCCTFRVVYGSQMCHAGFKKLLAGIPEVTVMADPAPEKERMQC